MIVSFGDGETEALFHGERPRRLPQDLWRRAQRKLIMLHAAHVLSDLGVPPGNRLEALRGEWKGLHSVRVSRQWRLVFRWTALGPAEVRILDYHE